MISGLKCCSATGALYEPSQPGADQYFPHTNLTLWAAGLKAGSRLWISFLSESLCLLLSLSLSFCLSMTQYLSFHLYSSPLCLSLWSALLSARAPFISVCHWAMCAVPVSKTAGRPSSFPRWGMRGQCGSCESYRLGSIKASPFGKLPLSVFLFGGRPDLVHLDLDVTYCAVKYPQNLNFSSLYNYMLKWFLMAQISKF